MRFLSCSFFFFFNDTATTEIYTLSLHDALPIYVDALLQREKSALRPAVGDAEDHGVEQPDRKSTRLNSSHGYISYAVFCLKKKKKKVIKIRRRMKQQNKSSSTYAEAKHTISSMN